MRRLSIAAGVAAVGLTLTVPRALLIPMAALTLFVFAMQLTLHLRRSRPAMHD